MVTINLSREVHAELDLVWSIVADVDNVPYFWPGLNTVNNISKNGNTIEREVTVGFRNSKSCQTVVLNPRKSIKVSMTKGPIRGVRSITLNTSVWDNSKTRIDVSWDIDLSNIPISGRDYAREFIISEIISIFHQVVILDQLRYFQIMVIIPYGLCETTE
jgi:ribosome-associated toxin RatA of RatAB toxin-antitoxin module